MKTLSDQDYRIIEGKTPAYVVRLPGIMPIDKLIEGLREKEDDPFVADFIHDLILVMNRGWQYIGNGRLRDSSTFFLLYKDDPAKRGIYHRHPVQPSHTYPKLAPKNENRAVRSSERNAP